MHAVDSLCALCLNNLRENISMSALTVTFTPKTLHVLSDILLNSETAIGPIFPFELYVSHFYSQLSWCINKPWLSWDCCHYSATHTGLAWSSSLQKAISHSITEETKQTVWLRFRINTEGLSGAECIQNIIREGTQRSGIYHFKCPLQIKLVEGFLKVSVWLKRRRPTNMSDVEGKKVLLIWMEVSGRHGQMNL